jgi:two-component system, NtrC family, sensor histidine kinase HydH
MDFHLWTPVISAVLALAIAAKVILRSRKRRAHWLFIGFATNVAVWYLATFIEYRAHNNAVWGRITALTAVFLPQTVVRFLRAFRPGAIVGQTALDRWATYLFVPMLGVVLSPWFDQRFWGATIRVAISAYVVGLLIAAVSALYTGGRNTSSRMEQRRSLYLVGVGVAATLVTTADLVPFTINKIFPGEFPPLGTILVLAVLYMFSEVVERRRLIDLYELAGRFVVLTALALVLAGIYYRLVDWQVIVRRGTREGPYFLNAIVASLVILILFDPLRAKVEEQTGRFFFGERFDFDRAVTDVRKRLAHTLELDALGRVLMAGLDTSRRVTFGALYLVDADRRGLELFAHLGVEPKPRHELAPLRGLFEMVKANGSAVLEQIERERDDRLELGETREAEVLAESARHMDAIGASIVLPLESDAGDLIGILAVSDDRMRDAFSPDEVQMLRALAAQAAIVVENSRLHARIKERDRLAALGEMAAGLAHEIRNPLGAIKGAAQVMDTDTLTQSQKELITIIHEEVERLNHVVGSFLDYARPYRGNPVVLDVTPVIERTSVLLRNDLPAGIDLRVELPASLPTVRIDPEHVRQVLFNLVRNAFEALKGTGHVTITARARSSHASVSADESVPDLVELIVQDTGPGIDPAVQRNLFIPFFTTKASGTGLGLAISQRLIESAGGRVLLRSSAAGTTFTVALPVAGATTSGDDVSEKSLFSTGENERTATASTTDF